MPSWFFVFFVDPHFIGLPERFWANCPNLAAYHAVSSLPWPVWRHSLATAVDGAENVSSAEAEHVSEHRSTWPLYAPQDAILLYPASIAN